jgi:hypothetical protein
MMNCQRSGPSKQTLLIVSLLSFIVIITFSRFPFSNLSPSKHTLTNSKMGIVHVVMFEFNEEATAEQIADVRYPNPKRIAVSLQAFRVMLIQLRCARE